MKDINVGAREGEASICASSLRSPAREGEEIEPAVDTSRLHFFDLESAAAIDRRG